MTSGALIKSFCVAAALVVGLSGCGRKGELERPGVSASPVTDPGQRLAPAVRDRRFILDGLLD
jgi:predicted small lipoprotein YifL